MLLGRRVGDALAAWLGSVIAGSRSQSLQTVTGDDIGAECGYEKLINR
jgi:hypothetical protein